MKTGTLRRTGVAAAMTLGLCLGARAEPALSDASAASMLPVAVSVAAPAMLLSAGAMLTAVSVEATGDGAIWVLERASDGARASVRVTGRGLAGASLAAGTTIAVTAMSTGWVLSAAGQAIALIPNALGNALLYNERIAR